MSKTSQPEEEKKAIRKRILSIRRKLNEELVNKYSHIICDKLIRTDAYKSASNVCIYMPIQNEVDVSLLQDVLRTDNKRVYLPRIIQTDGENAYMEFYLYTQTTRLINGAYNIPEPDSSECLFSTPDTLIVMPGAVFSKTGRRIGYGGGYYDRYLATHTECQTIAVAYDFQILDEIPYNEYDIQPQLIISESYEIRI